MEFEEIVEFDRTEDVKTTKEFASLMLSENSLHALAKAGYTSPSPVQVLAIPLGLLGFDILVQAKSGTGKTLVFSLLALEGLNAQSFVPQVLILAPTREIALQICGVITRLAPRVVRVEAFVGGEKPLKDDIAILKKGIHVIVGTSGRLCHLVSIKALKTDFIRLFVLDEADKLMDDNFQKDINYLFSSLPAEKQVAVFSATYPHNIDSILAQYMRNARLVRPGTSDVQLIGIKQYVVIRYAQPAIDSLISLLRSITFSQCIIYANDYTKKAFFQILIMCKNIYHALLKESFDVALISSAMEQTDRNKIMKQLKNFNVKILVSTDLTARGIDAENVNAIINMAAPLDCETYLHRIGRAGRFGGYGAAFTIASSFKEVRHFTELVKEGNLRVRILHLDSAFPPDLCQNELFYNSCADFIAGKPKSRKLDKKTETEELESYLSELSDEEREVAPRCLKPLLIVPFDSEIERNANLYDSLSKPLIVSQVQKNARFSNVDSDVTALNHEKVVYSRQELIRIRDLYTSHHWRFYAKNRFDSRLFKAPFVSRSLLRVLKVDTGSTKNGNSGCISGKLVEQSPNHEERMIKSEVNPVRFKFQRTTARKKVYTKAGLVQIRNSRSEKEWYNFATHRFNIDMEPFTIQKLGENSQIVGHESESIFPNTPEEEMPRQNKTPSVAEDEKLLTKTPICYSHEDLLAIRDRRISQEWETWAKSRYATDEEPFQLDVELRVPVPVQLRVLRKREKAMRQKVQSANSSRPNLKPDEQVIASSRFVYVNDPIPDNPAKYIDRILHELEKLDTKDVPEEPKGPVVTLRHTPQEFQEIISSCSKILEETRLDFFDHVFGAPSNSRCSSSEAKDTVESKFRDASTQVDFLDSCMRRIKKSTSFVRTNDLFNTPKENEQQRVIANAAQNWCHVSACDTSSLESLPSNSSESQLPFSYVEKEPHKKMPQSFPEGSVDGVSKFQCTNEGSVSNNVFDNYLDLVNSYIRRYQQSRLKDGPQFQKSRSS